MVKPVSALASGYDALPNPVFLITGNDGTTIPINEAARTLTSEQGFVETIGHHLGQHSANEAASFTFSLSPGDQAAARHFTAYLLPANEEGRVLLILENLIEGNLQTALAKSRLLYKDLTELASDFAWETDGDGRFSFISPKGAMGFRPEEMLGRQPQEFLANPGRAMTRLPFHPKHPTRHVEVWMLDKNEGERCLQISGLPMMDDAGRITGARGVALDVTAERKQQSEIAVAKNREELITYIVTVARDEDSPEATLTTLARTLTRALGAEGAIILTEAGLTAGAENVPGVEHWQVTASHGDVPAGILDSPELEYAPFKAGSVHHFDLGDVPVLGIQTRYRGVDNGAVFISGRPGGTRWHDDAPALMSSASAPLGLVIRQMRDQQSLQELARTDELTQLLNRRAFMETLDSALDRANRSGQPGALLYLDLDNFKPINDVLGHEAGDMILRDVANILRSQSRGYDLVARLGGDEFACWLDQTGVDTARDRADQIIADLLPLRTRSASPDRPFGVSIGIATLGEKSEAGLSDLINAADKAMYRAKTLGKNAVAVSGLDDGEETGLENE